MIFRAMLLAALLLGCGFDVVTECWKQRTVRSEIYELERDLEFERVFAADVEERFRDEVLVMRRRARAARLRQLESPLSTETASQSRGTPPMSTEAARVLLVDPRSLLVAVDEDHLLNLGLAMER